MEEIKNLKEKIMKFLKYGSVPALNFWNKYFKGIPQNDFKAAVLELEKEKMISIGRSSVVTDALKDQGMRNMRCNQTSRQEALKNPPTEEQTFWTSIIEAFPCSE